MAITKFTDVADSGYDVAINKDATFQSERDKFLQGLVNKIDELTDLINTHITDMAANNAKVSFPGLGTTSSTALAGDTTTISIAQAREITANTAKTSMTLGTSSTTALAGDTNIVTIGSSTTIAFGDMVTVPAKGKTPASYNIVMTVTNGGVSKSITLTLT
tara:strand:- start:485 stop:967 length:483 start_codon:yes stop_codon:yes gene_type:complete